LEDFADAAGRNTQDRCCRFRRKAVGFDHTDPFKEFLAVLIKDKWQIIFTTRNNYLEDLNYDYIDIYKIRRRNFDIRNLDHEELAAIAQAMVSTSGRRQVIGADQESFLSERVSEIYTGENIDYVNFKDKLWSRIIAKRIRPGNNVFWQPAFQESQ